MIPGHDESMTSWLIRMSRKHYCNTKTFCNFYDLQSILNSSLDINANTALIQSTLYIPFEIPQSFNDKIPDFKWDKGRSKWLIEPNKKGHASLNGFTKFCPECLSKKGYFQLKWQLNLFIGCLDCLCYLLNSCPICKNVVSPIKADIKYPVKDNLNPLNLCWYCEFDLRESKSKKMTTDDIDFLLKITKAYDETPINIRYLTFMQFGTIEGISNHKL